MSQNGSVTSSNNLYLAKKRFIYTAIIHKLPNQYHSPRSLYDILKEYPNLNIIDIVVKRDGVAFVKSRDENIVKKLKVLQYYIKQPLVITAPVPKEKIPAKKTSTVPKKGEEKTSTPENGHQTTENGHQTTENKKELKLSASESNSQGDESKVLSSKKMNKRK